MTCSAVLFRDREAGIHITTAASNATSVKVFLPSFLPLPPWEKQPKKGWANGSSVLCPGSINHSLLEQYYVQLLICLHSISRSFVKLFPIKKLLHCPAWLMQVSWPGDQS